MGNICGGAPSKESSDEPIDHKTIQKQKVCQFITQYVLMTL